MLSSKLVDRSVVYPEGVLEDVFVQVNSLILDIEDDKSSNSSNILLGRPFLSIIRTKIDVHDGTFTTKFDGEITKFNVYDAMTYPNEVSSIFSMDIIDYLAQEILELGGDDKLRVVFCENINLESLETLGESDDN